MKINTAINVLITAVNNQPRMPRIVLAHTHTLAREKFPPITDFEARETRANVRPTINM